jgi:hypothetical protein
LIRRVESFFNIFPVTLLEEPVVIKVPVSFGIVTVWSDVGSITVIVISFEFAVDPSRIIVPFAPSTKEVKVPAAALVPPIVVPSIAPALISTVASVAVPLTVALPVVLIFSSPKLIAPELSVREPAATTNPPIEKEVPTIAAKVPAAAELAPITVPSIAPALISTVASVAVPVVLIFSLPKLIAPELSVIEPAANARVPPFRVVPLTVVVASVVIVAEVCVPATTPLILGADNDITVDDALIPLLRLVAPLPPRTSYNSTKLALSFVAPALNPS